MKKFKDFLYDKNDVLIALLILVAAALLIIWRMDAIMEYPKNLLGGDVAEEGANAQTGAENDAEGEQNGENAGEGAGDSQSGESGDLDSGDGESGDEGAGGSAAASPWQNGVLAEDMTIEVPGGSSAYDAVQLFVDAGLFDSYAEYQSICEENGWNHQMVAGGSIQLEAGFTKTDVARSINYTW